MRQFIWASEFPRFSDALSLTRKGIIPVVLPRGKSRRQRWTEILAWHGLELASSGAASDGERGEHFARDPVIALDSPSAAFARFYAAVSQRPFLRARSPTDISAMHQSGAFASVMIFAAPALLDAKSLRHFSDSFRVPWGVVTAPDPASMSFTVAKLLATPRDLRKYGLVNQLNLTVATSDEKSAWDGPRPLGPVENRDLVEQEWAALAIAAHGAGAHANLGCVVLCGIVGNRENGIHRKVASGCGIKRGKYYCKRVHDTQRKIKRFGDLRAETVLFFTCNGFTVAGDLYPSDGSCVLSASEGYPKEVLTTSRPVEIDPRLPELAIRLVMGGARVGDIQWILNEERLASEESAPYILFGDPRLEPVRGKPALGSISSSPAGACSLVKLNLAARTTTPILGLEPPLAATLWRAGTSGILLPSGCDPGSGAPRVVDKSAHSSEVLSSLISLGQLARRAAHIERSLQSIYYRRLAQEAQLRQKVSQLIEVRLLLESAVQAGLKAQDRGRRSGVWDATADSCLAVARIHCGIWDMHCASVIAHLIDDQLPDVFTDGFRLRPCGESGTCIRCRSPLTLTRACAPLADQPDRLQRDCPVCGPYECWRDGEGQFTVECPRTVRPGGKVTVKMRRVRGDRTASAATCQGQLLIDFEDKGRGVPAWRSREIISGEVHAVAFTVPAELSLELHALRLVWVHGLDVSFQRHRCAGVRRG